MRQPGRAPRAGAVATVTCVLAVAFSLLPETWTGVVIALVIVATVATSVSGLSRRQGWGPEHATVLLGGWAVTRARRAATPA